MTDGPASFSLMIHCGEEDPGSSRLRLAAVLVTWNGARWIERCLRSLEGVEESSIFVVDNGSQDETLELIRRTAPAARVIQLRENVGFGRANNLGIQHALAGGADAVLLLNQDIVCVSGMIDALETALRSTPDFGLVSALQLSYDATGLDDLFVRFLPREYLNDLVLGRERPVYEAQFMPAAAVLVRSVALLEVGGFDPLFFAYGEDVDLCDRMRAAGWKVGLVPKAHVQHWHGQIHGERSFRREANLNYSRAVMHLKRSPRRPIVAFAGLVNRWLLPEWKELPARAVALARAAWQLRRMGRARRTNPHQFAGPPEDCVPHVEEVNGCCPRVEPEAACCDLHSGSK